MRDYSLRHFLAALAVLLVIAGAPVVIALAATGPAPPGDGGATLQNPCHHPGTPVVPGHRPT